jgi:threonine dehydrogenase-like Zn-dependent dehydrogenase
MTAATKSNAVINLAMELTRAKGTVVIVGDVGLNVDRSVFYRKEIDLLMSTSYGPGRYDATYEAEGHDYPYAHVRWTLKQQSAWSSSRQLGRRFAHRSGDRDEAPAVYDQLAKASDAAARRLIHYADDGRRR